MWEKFISTVSIVCRSVSRLRRSSRASSRSSATSLSFSRIGALAVDRRDALHNLRIAELTRFAPREIFRASQGLPAGHYSILIRITFQALERTLREEELQSYSQAVIAALESLGGRQRA